MLTPEELLHISEGAEEIAEQLHQDILDRIIERIMTRLDRGDNYILTAYDKWQIQVLQDAGFLLEDIQKEIAKRTPYMQSEIAEAMEDAGVRSMAYDNKIYEAAGLSPLPLEQSPHLIRLTQRNYEKTLGEMKNFTGTLAGAAQQSFIRGCDKAYNLVSTGTVGYTQAVKEVVNDIVKDGVIVEYPSGHTDTIETATLRAVRTGVSQATAEITEERMVEMDWDIVLVSSHLGARVTDKEDFTNHYWWQGKFYSKSGKNKKFPPFSVCNKGHVQGICGANCRHSYGPGDGEFNPYEQFDSEENQKAYEQQQRQRTLERRIRKTKREVMGLQTARDNALDDTTRAELDLEYQRKAALLQKQNKAYDVFCEGNGLKKLRDRIDVARWDRKQAAAARGAAKRYGNQDKLAELHTYESSNNITDNEAANGLSQNLAEYLAIDANDVSLAGLPIESQQVIVDSIKRVMENYPQLKGHLRSVKFNDKLDSVALSKSITGQLEIGPAFLDLEALDKSYNYGVKLGYHPKGTTYKSIIPHEIGHLFDGLFTKKKLYGASISEYGVIRTSQAVQKEILSKLGLTDQRLVEIRAEYRAQGYTGKELTHAVRFERREFIEKHISNYANRNEREFFAECFSEYMTSDSPREAAVIFGEIFERLIGEL